MFNVDADGNDKVIFTVINTGSGIPDKVAMGLVKLMLDDDESAPSAHDGFGLEISSSLVKELDGFLGFQTMVDVGASFSFCIPLEKAIGSAGLDDCAFPQSARPGNDSCNVENDMTIADEELAFNKIQKLRGRCSQRLMHGKERIPEEDMEEEAVDSASQDSPRAQRQSQNQEKILLVNDDQTNLDQMKFFIKTLQMENAEERVTLCRSG